MQGGYELFKKLCIIPNFNVLKWLTRAFDITKSDFTEEEIKNLSLLCFSSSFQRGQWFSDTFQVSPDVDISEVILNNAIWHKNIDALQWWAGCPDARVSKTVATKCLHRAQERLVHSYPEFVQPFETEVMKKVTN